MKIYATQKVSSELQKLNDDNYMKSLQKAINNIQQALELNLLNDNSNISKLKTKDQPIYSYRIDRLSRLLFTYTEDENKEKTITLLDIARHNSKLEQFVSGSTEN
jgi:mRNA-degrading endonuclease RelE of RelBE toxin-antitoxin system